MGTDFPIEVTIVRGLDDGGLAGRRWAGNGLSVHLNPRPAGAPCTVTLQGRLDAQTMPLLTGLLEHLHDRAVQRVTLDFTHVVVPHVWGLTDLAALQRRYVATGRELRIEGARASALPVLHAAELAATGVAERSEGAARLVRRAHPHRLGS